MLVKAKLQKYSSTTKIFQEKRGFARRRYFVRIVRIVSSPRIPFIWHLHSYCIRGLHAGATVWRKAFKEDTYATLSNDNDDFSSSTQNISKHMFISIDTYTHFCGTKCMCQWVMNWMYILFHESHLLDYFITTHLLSIEHADCLKLHDMFKARDTKSC